MPIARFQMPDGRIARFEVPEGTTPEQAHSMMQSYDFGAATQAPQNSDYNPDDMGEFAAFAQNLPSAVPFSQRIMAGGAALANYPIAKLTGSDITLAELYDTARERQKATDEANPNAALAGSLTGAAATLPIGFAKSSANALPVIGKLANASQKAASTAGRYVGGAPTAGKRILRSAVVAAPASGVYGYGSSENDLNSSEALGDGLWSAGMGALGGAALPATSSLLSSAGKGAKNIATGIKARTGDELTELGGQMKGDAVALRNQMKEMGARLTPEAAASLNTRLNDALQDIDIIPELTPKSNAILNRIREKSAEGIDLNHLDQYRRALRSAGGEDSAVAGAIRSSLDDTVNRLKPADFASGGNEAVSLLNNFRKSYTQASKFDEIAEIVKKADGDSNMLKRDLSKLYNNPDRTRGYTQAEMDALRNAAKYTAGEGLLKAAGKFGFDFNTRLGNAALPTVGGLLTGSPALPAVGTAARYGQKYLAQGKAENLLRTIESGAKTPPKTKGDLFQQALQKLAQPAPTLDEILLMSPTEAQKHLKRNVKK